MNGQFKKFNQFWKLREKNGRDPIFSNPDDLVKLAFEYFESCDMDQSWNSKKTVDYEEKSNTETKEVRRPYTRSGFMLFLGVSENWMREFKKKCSDDFLEVISLIETTIDTQQIEGAMVGAFNSNLVARIQGIKDQSDVTTNGKEINRTITPEEAKKLADELDNEY